MSTNFLDACAGPGPSRKTRASYPLAPNVTDKPTLFPAVTAGVASAAQVREVARPKSRCPGSGSALDF
jgi:hypothetical protein